MSYKNIYDLPLYKKKNIYNLKNTKIAVKNPENIP